MVRVASFVLGDGHFCLSKSPPALANTGCSLQVYHWNYARQIEQYYYDLAKINKAKQQDQ